MHPLFKKISELFWEEPVTLVLPSEVAARYMRLYLLESTSSRSALREDRVISWDTFKELAIGSSLDRKSANRVFRTLFVKQLLKEHIHRPFLQYFLRTSVPALAGEAYAYASFEPLFLQVLPYLPKLVQTLHKHNVYFLEQELKSLLQDLEEIQNRYVSFLEQYSLFEPTYEHLALSDSFIRRIRPVLLFPELLLDVEEYRNVVSPIQQIRLPAPDFSIWPTLWEYPNSFQELRALMLQLSKLLDKGVGEHEIAVSFPGLTEYEEQLMEQAKVFGVPLSIQQGKSVTDYPGARWIRQLAQIKEENFSLGSLKSFLLDQSLFFRDPALIRRLLLRGASFNCLHKKNWDTALQGEEELQSFWKRFVGALTKVYEAPHFEELRVALVAFFEQFLTPEIPPESKPAFQFALSFLQDLAYQLAGVDLSSLNPFSLFYDLAKNQLYVPIKIGLGVSVYPYRVAGGSPVGHHFLVNCSRSALQVHPNLFPFLREDQKESLGIQDTDLSELFFFSYGIGAKNLYLSYSRENREGAQLPVLWLEGWNREQSDPPIDIQRAQDPLWIERKIWEGNTGDRPDLEISVRQNSFPQGYQKEGALRFLVHGWQRPFQINRACIASSTLRELLIQKLYREEEKRFVLSPTDLEGYVSCPLQFLFRRLLNIEDTLYDLWFFDAAWEGRLFHEGAKQLMGLYHNKVTQLEEHQFKIPALELLESLGYNLEGLLEKYIRYTNQRPLAPVLKGIEKGLATQLVTLLQKDLETFADWQIVDLEKTYSIPMEGKPFAFRGRMDRISKSPDGKTYSIIDYKTGETPRVSKIRSSLADPWGQPPYFQLLTYLFIASKVYPDVTLEAYYYSTKEGKFSCIAQYDPAIAPQAAGQGNEGKQEINEQEVIEEEGKAKGRRQAEHLTAQEIREAFHKLEDIATIIFT
ncbi:MAG: PD-(D/E)XK nuclease family protein, partial [Spirochaetales bacterium]